MNHRFFNEDEKRERAVRVENLKAAYANPEKLRQGVQGLAENMAELVIDGTFGVKRRDK